MNFLKVIGLQLTINVCKFYIYACFARCDIVARLMKDSILIQTSTKIHVLTVLSIHLHVTVVQMDLNNR